MSDREIDLPDLLAALGLGPDAPAQPVAGGADTAIWRVSQAGASYAVRLFRQGEAAVMAREVAAMAAAALAGVPTPQVHAEVSWMNRPALLLEWMPGQRFDLALQATPWRAWRLGVAFGETQARMHQALAPAALREADRPWIAWAEPPAVLRDLLLAATDDRETLLHLDYHPRNVLVEGSRVSAVLDWTNARAGDRRADLARTDAILRFGPIAAGLPSPIARVVTRGFAAGWRHGYRERAGPVRGMAPFYAWAGMVMVRDLAPRLGRADLPWITSDLLARVQSWSDGWLERATETNGGRR